MATDETKFDLQVVHDNFVTSLTEEDDVILKHYLDSYYELNKCATHKIKECFFIIRVSDFSLLWEQYSAS